MKPIGITFSLIVTVFVGGAALAQSDTTQMVVPDRRNSPAQQSKPYVILISVDGFRSDYVKKHNATHLRSLSAQGTTAEYMLASYPSLTFPNHYTLATGLYPAHHGLVDNTFYDNVHRSVYEMHNYKIVHDSSWYGGTPLWVLAEQQKMVTASFYWVASDVGVQGTRPTYSYSFNETIPIARRLNTVRNWLELPEDKRPHLITFYFAEVDHESHTHGPDAKETRDAVQQIDASIGQLAAMTDSLHLPVNFIVVSDHGMASVDTVDLVSIPPVLLDTTVCRLVTGSTQLHVYVKNPQKILPLYHQLQKESKGREVYLPQDIPARWHYGKQDDLYGRIGDILVVATFPKVFKLGNRKVTPGKHGYDPSLPEMHATFLAWGPQIKKLKIPAFENVHVFPLVAEILGLTYEHRIDGDRNVLKPILH